MPPGGRTTGGETIEVLASLPDPFAGSIARTSPRVRSASSKLAQTEETIWGIFSALNGQFPNHSLDIRRRESE